MIEEEEEKSPVPPPGASNIQEVSPAIHLPIANEEHKSEDEKEQ